MNSKLDWSITVHTNEKKINDVRHSDTLVLAWTDNFSHISAMLFLSLYCSQWVWSFISLIAFQHSLQNRKHNPTVINYQQTFEIQSSLNHKTRAPFQLPAYNNYQSTWNDISYSSSRHRYNLPPLNYAISLFKFSILLGRRVSTYKRCTYTSRCKTGDSRLPLLNNLMAFSDSRNKRQLYSRSTVYELCISLSLCASRRQG